MNKFFANLLCCSLTLPLLLQAETSQAQSPSQKKFTRKQLSQAANTPAKKSEEKKKNKEKTSAAPAKKTTSSPSKHSVISNSSGASIKRIPQKSKISKGSPVILAAAEETEKKTTSSEEPSSKHCEPGPNSFRFSMSHREGKGIGYPQGYTSLSMFFAFSATEKAHPFFDIRGHMSNDGKPAANIGFGIRYLPDRTNAVFGINAFFDFRQARHSTFEQLGLGLEILGTQWSLHLNGYMPIIRTDNLVEVSFYKFSGNRALIHLENEVALKGADASLGRSLVHRGFFDLDAYLGGYFFQGKKQLTAPGGYIKLTSSLSRFFSVELQGSYDTLYKMIFQGAAAINIPLGKRVKIGNPERSCYTETALSRNLTDPVSRFEMIVTHLHQDTEIGLDPRTDLPLSILFVNNTSSGGSGTAEDPYSTLLAAQTNSSPEQMIYVYTGNGTSSGMDFVGITLKNRQWLQGSATPFDLLSSAGPVLVPAQTNQLPYISSLGNGVTLASGNIVNGFKITALGSNIYASTSVINAQIMNNVLSDATYDIQFLNAAGQIDINSNMCNSLLATHGIDIASTTTFSANIVNNTFTNSGAANIYMDLTGNSLSNVVIENNFLRNSTDGLEIILENNAISTVRIEGNTFTNQTALVFGSLNIFPRDQSNMTANIFSNTFSGPTPGIYTVASGTSSLSLGVIDNFIFSSASEGAVFVNDILSAATTTLGLLGNTSTSTVGYAFENLAILDTFNVMSPNLQLSGVENINTGSIGIAGYPINYIPYNPPTVE